MSGRGKTKNVSGGFQFVNVTHPNQAKDKKAKSQIFSHAMRDHLRKEGSRKSRTSKGTWLPKPKNVSNQALQQVAGTAHTPTDNTERQAHELTVHDPRNGVSREGDPAFEAERENHVSDAEDNVNDAVTASLGSTRVSSNIDKTPSSALSNIPPQVALVSQLYSRISLENNDNVVTRNVHDSSLLDIKQQLLNLAQEDRIFPGRNSVYLFSIDLIQGDIISLESHRFGAAVLIHRSGGILTWNREHPIAAQTFLTTTLLTDIFLEQPPIDEVQSVELRDLVRSNNVAASPLSWPAGAEDVLRKSSLYSMGTIELLIRLRELIAVVIEVDAHSPSSSITSDPRVIATGMLHTYLLPSMSQPTSAVDRIRRPVLLAAILLAIAIANHIPISEAVQLASEAAKAPNIIDEIATALQRTNVSTEDASSGLGNVLLFVCLIALPATRQEEDVDDELEESHLSWRTIRALVVSLSSMIHSDMSWAWFESLLTMLGVQKWLEADDSQLDTG